MAMFSTSLSLLPSMSKESGRLTLISPLPPTKRTANGYFGVFNIDWILKRQRYNLNEALALAREIRNKEKRIYDLVKIAQNLQDS
jgi:hypothetical protein